MDITTIIGLAAGFGCIIVSILISEGATISSFIDWPSVMIVFGGTIASTVIAPAGKDLKTLPGILQAAFKKNSNTLSEEIHLIAEMSMIAKKNGMLYLENSLENISDPFMKKGILLIMDGTDPEYIRTLMEAEIYYMQERHAKGQAIVDTMAGFAPAYGMVGTLIGLINMLKNLDDADSLGPSMAVALVTTFYGVILANLIFTPISKKLKANTAQETLRKELLLEGILAIQVGENPRLIKDRLSSFLSNAEIKRIEGKAETREASRGAEKEIENG